MPNDPARYAIWPATFLVVWSRPPRHAISQGHLETRTGGPPDAQAKVREDHEYLVE